MSKAVAAKARAAEKRAAKAAREDALARAFAENIEAVFLSASAAERRAGLDWYPTALKDAAAIGARYNVPTATVVGIISALSPGVAWEANVAQAEGLVRAVIAGDKMPSFTTYGENVDKARRIMAAQPSTHAAVRRFFNDTKTGFFTDNIMGVGNATVVTVDGHAYNIARYGMRRETITKVKRIPAEGLRASEWAYRHVAAKYGMEPRQMQAVTWGVYRSMGIIK